MSALDDWTTKEHPPFIGYHEGWAFESVHLWPFMTEEGPKQRLERLYDRCCHGGRG